jgi:hypothetical protein
MTLNEILSEVIFDLIRVHNLPMARVPASQQYLRPKEPNPCKKVVELEMFVCFFLFFVITFSTV